MFITIKCANELKLINFNVALTIDWAEYFKRMITGITGLVCYTDFINNTFHLKGLRR